MPYTIKKFWGNVREQRKNTVLSVRSAERLTLIICENILKNLLQLILSAFILFSLRSDPKLEINIF